MTTTDHAAAIAAAEATLAAAQAEVDRLRSRLAEEHAAASAQPRKATWEDGVAAARKRHPGRTRSEMAATAAGTGPAYDGDAAAPYLQRTPEAHAERYGVDITTVEGAKTEARRRGSARKSSYR